MRLGHPHSQVLQQLSARNSISVNKITKLMCEACQSGKSSRLLFSSYTFVVSRLLEKIHCDLWSPSLILSVKRV